MIVHRKLTALTAAAFAAAMLGSAVPAAATPQPAPTPLDTPPPAGDPIPRGGDVEISMRMEDCHWALQQAGASLNRYFATGNSYWWDSYNGWMDLYDRHC